MSDITKCVIVDDNYLSIEMTKEFLSEQKGFEIIGEFVNPIKAVPFIQQNDPDLIFLDVQMPGITGIDMLKIF